MTITIQHVYHDYSTDALVFEMTIFIKEWYETINTNVDDKNIKSHEIEENKVDIKPLMVGLDIVYEIGV